jgi:hypothetical protein
MLELVVVVVVAVRGAGRPLVFQDALGQQSASFGAIAVAEAGSVLLSVALQWGALERVSGERQAETEEMVEEEKPAECEWGEKQQQQASSSVSRRYLCWW